MHPRVERVLAWLRASYPSGVPETDYQPLLALMRRRLSDEEVEALGQQLVVDGLVPADRVDVGVEVTKVTQDLPTPAELDRVMVRLRGSGFPVDDDWGATPAGR